VDKVIDHKKKLLPADYKYFGCTSNVENLELLLQKNLFSKKCLTQSISLQVVHFFEKQSSLGI